MTIVDSAEDLGELEDGLPFGKTAVGNQEVEDLALLRKLRHNVDERRRLHDLE